MPSSARYYRCDRCGEVFLIVDSQDHAKVPQRNGPNAVSFRYAKLGRGEFGEYQGEWCDECTRLELQPLTRLKPKEMPA